MALWEVAAHACLAINEAWGQRSRERGASEPSLRGNLQGARRSCRVHRPPGEVRPGVSDLGVLHAAVWHRLLGAARGLRDARRALPTGADWRTALLKSTADTYSVPLVAPLGPGLENYVPLQGARSKLHILLFNPFLEVPMIPCPGHVF